MKQMIFQEESKLVMKQMKLNPNTTYTSDCYINILLCPNKSTVEYSHKLRGCPDILKMNIYINCHTNHLSFQVHSCTHTTSPQGCMSTQNLVLKQCSNQDKYHQCIGRHERYLRNMLRKEELGSFKQMDLIPCSNSFICTVSHS